MGYEDDMGVEGVDAPKVESVIEYSFSKNDLDTLESYKKYHNLPSSEMQSITKKSLILLSNLCGGLHHLGDNQVRRILKENDSWCVKYLAGHLATYDGWELTKLVLLAHDMAIRVEIQPCNFRYFTILFHERQREGEFSRRHPSIEQVLQAWRKKD